MTLYSPSLTSKPRNAVNALYRSPREWGNSICLRKSMRLPRPQPQVPVTHSPTPSTVRIAASSKGEHRKALAAWERWCSQNRTRSLGIPNSAEMVAPTQRLAIIQFKIDDVLRMVDPLGRPFLDLQGVRKQTSPQAEG